jgi:hypothetical protein
MLKSVQKEVKKIIKEQKMGQSKRKDKMYLLQFGSRESEDMRISKNIETLKEYVNLIYLDTILMFNSNGVLIWIKDKKGNEIGIISPIEKIK